MPQSPTSSSCDRFFPLASIADFDFDFRLLQAALSLESWLPHMGQAETEKCGGTGNA